MLYMYKATLHTINQTTLGLVVKLQHRHGCSEFIRLLHDHGFIVSYDEVIRLRKSATKSVGDSYRSSILHQAMGLSRRVRPIFGWFDNLDLLVKSTPNGRRDTHVMAQEFQQHPSGILETGSAPPGTMNLVIPCLLLSASRYLKISTIRSVQHRGFHILIYVREMRVLQLLSWRTPGCKVTPRWWRRRSVLSGVLPRNDIGYEDIGMDILFLAHTWHTHSS